MTVTYIGETEGAIPPVPTDDDGDEYEIDWPPGAAVGDLVVLHAGLTKSALDAYPSRFEFHGDAMLDDLPTTLEADSLLTLTISASGTDTSPRVLSLRFGLITADTPDPIPLQVLGASPDPLHGTDRFGITVWRGVTQAFVKSRVGEGENGTVPAHTAPHSVTWFAQAGYEGIVEADDPPGTGWEWDVVDPFNVGFVLFDETVNRDRGVGVSEDFFTGDDTADAGFSLDFGATDPVDPVSDNWGAYMIGLSDQAAPPVTEQEPEFGSEGFGIGSVAVTFTLESAAQAPEPSGGVDVPLFPYRTTKDVQ